MRKAILAILMLSASTAYCQFSGGGGCPSGGFVDRYSNQNVSGEKIFCSTATFNIGIALGLDPNNILGPSPMPLDAPGGLYWGNKAVCLIGDDCGGGGGGGGVVGVVGGAVGLGIVGQDGYLSVFNSTWAVVNSVIQQKDLESTISISTYTLSILHPDLINKTIYGAGGISTTKDFQVRSGQNLTLLSQSSMTVVTNDKMLIGSNGDMFIGSSGKIDINSGPGGLQLDGDSSADLNIRGFANITLGEPGTPGYSIGATGVFQAAQCATAPDKWWRISVGKGIIVGIECL